MVLWSPKYLIVCVVNFQIDSLMQELAGFFVTIWIAAVMFKSNDILRKQTALKVLELRNWFAELEV